MDGYTRSIDVGVSVGLAAMLTLFSFVILLAHKLGGRDPENSIPAAWFYGAFGALFFAAIGLVAGRFLSFGASAVWVLCGTTLGLLSAFVGLTRMMDPGFRSDRWVSSVALALIVQCGLIVIYQRIELIFAVSSIINATFCILFIRRIELAATRMGFDVRLFLTMPFAVVAIAYGVRLVAMAVDAPQQMVVVASIAIAFVLSFASVVWVFGALTLQMFHMRKAMERTARRDPLTDLLNRYALDEALADVTVNDQLDFRLGDICFCIDLDEFKVINDTMGHAAGDAALTSSAARLQRACQGFCARVYRIGGDEFIILTNATACPQPMDFAGRVLGILREPVPFGPHQLVVAASIGVARADDLSPPRNLLQAGDLALYDAKARGRGCAVLYDGTQIMDRSAAGARGQQKILAG